MVWLPFVSVTPRIGGEGSRGGAMRRAFIPPTRERRAAGRNGAGRGLTGRQHRPDSAHAPKIVAAYDLSLFVRRSIRPAPSWLQLTGRVFWITTITDMPNDERIDSQPSIDGTWTHNSFLIDPTKLTVKRWAVDGQLTAQPGDDGSFKGELVFSPPGRANIILHIEGKVTAGEGSDPTSFEATGKGQEGTPLAPFVYHLKGWLSDTGAKPVVRGSVMNPGPDLAGESPGTVGAFILEKTGS